MAFFSLRSGGKNAPIVKFLYYFDSVICFIIAVCIEI